VPVDLVITIKDSADAGHTISELYDSQLAGLTEAIAIDGNSFDWQGGTYKCVLDHVAHNVTTLKTYFPNALYPKCGDRITVTGRAFQITKRANSQLTAVPGGFIEEPPFIDDPTDPSLDLTFDIFTRNP
jgi:hypothetical protein